MSGMILLTEEQLDRLIRKAVRAELAAAPVSPIADVLTLRGAAELLQMHPKVVGRFARANRIPALKIGHAWRFIRADLLRWLEEQHGDRQP